MTQPLSLVKELYLLPSHVELFANFLFGLIYEPKHEGKLNLK